jgi:pilus assembly protein FimV
MAQVQAQAESATGKGAAAPAPVVAPPVAAPVAPTKAPDAKAPETKAIAPAAPVAPPPKAEPPKAEPAKVEPPKAEAPKAEAPKAEAPKTDAPPPPKAAPNAIAKAPEPRPEPGFFEDLLSNTPTWAIGGGALAILAGIAALVAMRRRKTTKFEDSIISGTDIKTNTVFGSTGGGVVNTGENSLATDFSREGLGNIDTDEVDPIAEAEVYLAYGRDAQAEEILKEALKKDSQRQEIHLKLLEIHAQHNKPSAFETVAAELFSVSQGQGETWQKAVALGRQLDPTNPMFADTGAGAATAAAAGAVVAAAAHRAERPHRTTSCLGCATPGRMGGGREGDGGIDFRMDDDFTVSPASGPSPRRLPTSWLGRKANSKRPPAPPGGAAGPPPLRLPAPRRWASWAPTRSNM